MKGQKCGICHGEDIEYLSRDVLGIYQAKCRYCRAEGNWINTLTGEVYEWTGEKRARQARENFRAALEDAEWNEWADTGW